MWDCHQCALVKGLDVKAMIMHSMQMHKNDRNFEDALLHRFGKTKVIYGNGLVLYKCHLTGTKVDDFFQMKKIISSFESIKHSAEPRIHQQMQTFQPQPGPSSLPPINYPIGTHPGCLPAANHLSYHSVGGIFDQRIQSFHPQSTSSNRVVQQLVQTSTIPTKQPYQPDSTSSYCINYYPTIGFGQRKRPLQPEPSHSVKLTPEKKAQELQAQTSFLSSICVLNVIQSDAEDLPAIAMEIFRLLGIMVMSSEIKTVWRSNKTNHIIVEFFERKKRDFVLTMAYDKKLSPYDLAAVTGIPNNMISTQKKMEILIGAYTTTMYGKMVKMAINAIREHKIAAYTINETGFWIQCAAKWEVFLCSDELKEFLDKQPGSAGMNVAKRRFIPHSL